MKSAEQEEAEETARHAAAVQQLLGLVEGLEEELFNAEARRHDAEVEVRDMLGPRTAPSCRAPSSARKQGRILAQL